MTRHLATPDVGAVTAYIKEGSGKEGNYLTRYIAYEYITAQAAARRAQNVLGVLACLAGGAQLHSRANLEALGGQIDTTTLAEDTVTTFETQLAGRRVVFDGCATVLAEEPGSPAGLWKQRLRWARGNLQVTHRLVRKAADRYPAAMADPTTPAPCRLRLAARRVPGRLVHPGDAERGAEVAQDREDGKGGGRTVTRDDDDTKTASAPDAPEPQALARHAQDLTRQDRRSDRHLLWRELVVLLLIAAVLVARWQWLL
ncbi:glycosyltransferase [Streptomyces sp. NPDC016845]|uniref:glycosyltransferase n=1 Tax=Streptomyces sp. NPDC016845 TaxID=3364972 RepID=UPI0037AD8C3A